MRRSVFLTFSAALLLVAACTSKKATTSAKSPADVVAEVKKNYTADDMAHGKELWQSNCNKCHKLHDGPEFSVEKWENVLPRMIKRAKLSDDDGAKVRAYLIANSKM
ncbi:MAG: hypothetical protein JST82_04420 [Bacteroidetes bacterium]|nr:hypothetical protein [Bacteroidota bacterium]